MGYADVLRSRTWRAEDVADLIESLYAGGLGVTGWVELSETWTYASATTVTVPTDATTRFAKGVRVRLKQGGGYKYYVVTAVAATTLTIQGGTDYTVANSAITNIAISFAPAPVGYPGWFTYSPTWAASGSMTYTTVTTALAKFKIDGNTCTVKLATTAGTTGGSASPFITATPPVTILLQSSSVDLSHAYIVDGGTTDGHLRAEDDLAVLQFAKSDLSNFGLGADRVVRGTIYYEI